MVRIWIHVSTVPRCGVCVRKNLRILYVRNTACVPVLYFPCRPLCKWSLIIMALVFIQCYEDVHGTCVGVTYYDYDVHKRNSIGTVDRQPETMQASGSILDQSGKCAFGIRIQSVLSIGHWPHSTANHLPRQVWLYTEQSIFNIPKFSSSAVQLASVVWHLRNHTPHCWITITIFTVRLILFYAVMNISTSWILLRNKETILNTQRPASLHTYYWIIIEVELHSN